MLRNSAFSGRLASYLVGLAAPQKRVVVILADAAIVALASYLVLMLHLQRLILPYEYIKWLVIPVPLAVLPALQLTGVYDVMMRFWSSNQLFRLFAGTVLGTGGLFMVHGFGIGFGLYWNVLVLQALTILLALASLRYMAASMLRPVMHRPEAERVLVYGAGRAGTQLAAALMTSGEYWPVAFVDDRADLQGRVISGIRVFPPSRMIEIRERLRIKRALLAMPSATHRRRAEIVHELEKLAVKVMVMPGLDDLASGQKQVHELREVQVEDLLGRDPVRPDDALMDAFIRDKSVLITGAGGSIGSELARQVVQRGARRLVLLEVSELALYHIDMELREITRERHLDTEIVSVLGNILNKGLLERTLRRNAVETVYHAAAYKHVPLVEANIISGALNNVFGTTAVVEGAIAAGVSNFVLVSSDKAVRPTSVMGATKRVQELLVQAMAQEHPEMRVSMVRFGNVLASSGSVVPLFREQIRRGGPVTVTHPEVTRYFMTIPEAAQLVIQAGAMGSRGDLFVLDMGEPVVIASLARRMVHLSGFSVRDAANPDGDIEVQFNGLRPGEKLYEELLIDAEAQSTSHPRIWRAQEDHVGARVLQPALERIRAAIDEERCEAVTATLMQLVSGYQPGKAAALPPTAVVEPIRRPLPSSGLPDRGTPESAAA
ncbi:MAG TPA: nucleoside-diphosphate sugar epimerase/dehydratase [Solimonas sp.]|nr:nucleoside-diphosphate sugar epimerase/dehydratase [Solimonas sp.]